MRVTLESCRIYISELYAGRVVLIVRDPPETDELRSDLTLTDQITQIVTPDYVNCGGGGEF